MAEPLQSYQHSITWVLRLPGQPRHAELKEKHVNRITVMLVPEKNPNVAANFQWTRNLGFYAHSMHTQWRVIFIR